MIVWNKTIQRRLKLGEKLDDIIASLARKSVASRRTKPRRPASPRFASLRSATPRLATQRNAARTPKGVLAD